MQKAKAPLLIPVKANAYGLGIESLIPLLQELQPACLGIANPEEGVQLRQLGWTKEILMLGSFYKEDASLLRKHRIIPTITSLASLQFIAAAFDSEPVNVEVKFDTGMGRLGLLPAELEQFASQVLEHKNISITGIYTHFPCADQAESSRTMNQLSLFHDLSQLLIARLGLDRSKVRLHAANSYALLNFPESALDMARPGILFYGYYYCAKDCKKYSDAIDIRPGIKLLVRPIELRKLPKGATVSYGSNWSSPEDDYPVAVLPMGYADGIPRALSSRWPEQGIQLLGNVTMDQVMFGPVQSSDCIELLDNAGVLETWADIAGTTSYEILTGFGSRIKRVLS